MPSRIACVQTILRRNTACENSWHCLSTTSSDTQIWVLDSDWSWLNSLDSDWLSSKINKVLTLNNVNKSHHAQELPLFSTVCCILFVQLDIIFIRNTLETFLHRICIKDNL